MPNPFSLFFYTDSVHSPFLVSVSSQAFKKHKLIENIFETPGECDLTANVDFALLKEAINDTGKIYSPTLFLIGLRGIN